MNYYISNWPIKIFLKFYKKIFSPKKYLIFSHKLLIWVDRFSYSLNISNAVLQDLLLALTHY